MSGIAIESAQVADSAIARARRCLNTLISVAAKPIWRRHGRALLCSSVLVVASLSASAVMWSRPSSGPAAFAAEAVSEARAAAPARCPECGFVESLREVPPIAATADTPGAGARPARTYEITLRMKDGNRHRFTDTNAANWRVGERVMLLGAANDASR